MIIWIEIYSKVWTIILNLTVDDGKHEEGFNENYNSVHSHFTCVFCVDLIWIKASDYKIYLIHKIRKVLRSLLVFFSNKKI